MGWERGRYYTRSKKVNGRVLREYVGGGWVGNFAATVDEAARAELKLIRQERREQDEQFRQELQALDTEVAVIDKQIDLVRRGAMIAAGYHQHARGEWRKRRDNSNSGD